VVGDAPAMSAQVITRVSERGYDTVNLFETVVKPLRNALTPSLFKF
jgi:protein-L-isoaspartate(D-aspartate) O-methyltransferase